MRAKLRTWMGSWRVWAAVGYLVYLGLIYQMGASHRRGLAWWWCVGRYRADIWVFGSNRTQNRGKKSIGS